jgi:CBS domain containing-hemolysin-like protein
MNASTAQEMTVQEISLRLAVILLLIAINAFFVTAEFSVVSVRRSRVNQLVASGDRQARGVQRLQEQIDQLLSTTQLGITLSSLALGWIGERVVADLVAPLFTIWLGSSYLPLTHLLAVLFTFGVLAYLQIVLGELIPKSLALIYAEQSARKLSTPSLVIARIFMPLVWVLNHSTNWILRRLGIADNRHSRHQVSSQELELMIATERESVGLERNQRRILSKIFGLSAVTVADVMVPKPQMQTVPATATWRTVVNRVAQTNFSRYPVTGESPDDLVGTIHFRDLAKPLAAGQINLDSPIRSFIRPLALVPKATSIDELLLRMQEAGTAMAMVVDEYGGIVGLLTRKDAIAEILGKQKEDYPKPSSIVSIGQDQFLVQAQIPIAELNDSLGVDLPVTEGYQTLAGFLLYKLQQMPVTGETYRYQNLEFTVAVMDGTRIDRVRIRRQAL